MSETYERAKFMLESLVYSPASATGAYCKTVAGQQQEGLIPLEQQALFSRLQSYTVTTWFGKPPGLHPCDCAFKGWRNTGPDMLTCDTCGAKVWVKLPSNPLSDSAAGVVRRFTEQLTSGHDVLCTYSRRASSTGQQATAAAALQFPLVPSNRLAGSFSSRLQDLNRLDIMPTVQPSAVAKLATAAVQQLQDNALVKALALLLQVPLAVLQPAAAGQQTLQLSRNQAAALLALCGWRVQPLLPDHLAVSTAATAASAFAVSHLVPQRRHSASSSSQATTAGPSSTAGSSKISSAHAVLECELCGCQVGLWQHSCCGPFHAAQMTSKAAALVASAAATMAEVGPAATDPGLHAPAEALDEPAGSKQPPAAAAAAAAAGGVATAVAGSSVEVPGAAGAASEHAKQQQQEVSPQQQQVAAAAPGEVRSSLLHTIAGGNLLAAPAAGPFGQAAASSGGRYGLGFGRCRSGSLLLSPTQSGPFGSPPVPAFGSAAAAAAKRSVSVDRQDPQLLPGEGSSTGGGLFGLGNAAASVFEGFAGHADVPTTALAQQGISPAPVFGLGAFAEEVQRIKRRRSSSGAAMGPAGAAGSSAGGAAGVPSFSSPAHRTPPPAVGAVAAKVPGALTAAAPPHDAPAFKHDAQLHAAAAAGGAGEVSDDAAAAAAGGAGEVSDAAAAAAAAAAAGSAGRLPQKPRLLAAAAEKSSSRGASCFDPITHHKPWCPWVHTAGSGMGAAAAAAAGDADVMGSVSGAKALRLGWSSTLLALLEQMEDEQLQAAALQTAAVAQVSDTPQPGQFDTTAAVLAQARQMLDALE